MKKLTLLILLVMVASMLVAAIPTKMVRLTVINKSEFDVYIKLTGKVTGSFYYLTIPTGSKSQPMIKVFTIMMDLYERETWQCGGVHNSGTFYVDGNVRLTFVPCGQACLSCFTVDPVTGQINGILSHARCFYNWSQSWDWHHGCARFLGTGLPGGAYTNYHRWAGEPRMEKVTYFKLLWGPGTPNWALAFLYAGYLNYRCATWYYRIRSYMLPYGCAWRYQY